MIGLFGKAHNMEFCLVFSSLAAVNCHWLDRKCTQSVFIDKGEPPLGNLNPKKTRLLALARN